MELSQKDIKEIIIAIKAEIRAKGNSSISHRIRMYYSNLPYIETPIPFGTISTIEGMITKNNNYQSEKHPEIRTDYIIRKNPFHVRHPILYGIIMFIVGALIGSCISRIFAFF